MAEYYYNKGEDENTLKYIEMFEKLNPDSPLPSQMKSSSLQKNKIMIMKHTTTGENTT